MVKRIRHGKVAADEAKKAVLDVASVAFPDLGKARGIMGAIDHGEKAVRHAKEAAKKEISSRKRKVGKLLGWSQPKRKPARKASRRKTTVRRKR